jgi:hypothetical protein
MWARNLLFIGLVGAGVTALMGSLFPPRIAPRVAQPVADELPPSAYQSVVSEVDAEFHRQWLAAGVTPARRATDLAIARRLALALTGTIPSVQEIRRLEADPSGLRLEAYLARLFRDRRYADFLAERLAHAYVGTEDGPFLIYRRRRFVSWLSDEIMSNRPYDQLVRQLIADQGLWTDKPATNFVTVTVEMDKKDPNAERLAARVARAFLGIRLDCAQCHDHPFQKWKKTEFQGLAAYFGQVHPGFTGIHDGGGEFMAAKHKTGSPEAVEPHVPFCADLVPSDGARRWQLARWVTDPKNPALARATVNRLWALLLGRPLVEPVDDLGSVDELPPVLHLLADDFSSHGYDLQRLIHVIAATEVFRLDSAVEPEVTQAHEQHWATFPLTRLRPDQVAGGIVQASSLETLDRGSHILVQLALAIGEKEFIKRYGNVDDDDFGGQAETIPQRLLLMNGKLVYSKTERDLMNAASMISALATDDRAAVETAYLTVLTRRPTHDEASHFEAALAGKNGSERRSCLSDLFWTLINATEFSWNH